MIVLTDDIKEELMRPENLDWTLMSAVAGDDLRYGVKSLVEQLQAHQRSDDQLTIDKIVEKLDALLKEHKKSMDSVY